MYNRYSPNNSMNTSIVYIGATWCKTCKVIGPATEELAKRFQIPLTTLDIEEVPEEDKDSITKVPTIRIFQNKEKVAEWNVKQIESLTTWLSENVSLTTEDF